ncbi:MAG: IDEAL domain-containing protein [Ignavibacterium sp.]|nr:IDEAL domain-containing protein [Ignavibacterium sp.]
MKEDVYQYHFSFDELNFSEEKLISLFSDFSSNNYSVLSDAFNLLLPFIKQHCEPVAGFRHFNTQNISFRKNVLIIENIQFDLGTIIYRDIKDVSEIFVIVCTIGKNIEEKIHKFFLEGDSLSAFILDRIASELVESTADLLERKIHTEFLKEGYNLTNRYSPGYCGWSVSEQKKLFLDVHFYWKWIQHFQRQKIMRLIDEALDQQDEQKFRELTEQLKALR